MSRDPSWHNTGEQRAQPVDQNQDDQHDQHDQYDQPEQPDQPELGIFDWHACLASAIPVYSQQESTAFAGVEVNAPAESFLVAQDALYPSPGYLNANTDPFPGRWQPPRPMTMGGPTGPVPDQSAVQPVGQQTKPPPRPHRFISHDPQSQHKRRRMNVACNICRRRKIRCSGERPECQTCLSSGQSCPGYETSQHSRQQRSSTGSQSARDSNDDLLPSRAATRPDGGRLSAAPAQVSSTGLWPSEPRLHQRDFRPPPTPAEESAPSARERQVDRSAHEGDTASGRPSVVTYPARSHLPYFRYFGPAAAEPALRHHVAQGEDGQSTRAWSTAGSTSPFPATGPDRTAAAPSSTTAALGPPVAIQFYDPADARPVSPLVSHLCDTFFVHLGCSFPFLQKALFLHDLEGKKASGILVDAVCAVAARFSPHPILSRPSSGQVPVNSENEVLPGFRGHAFALRVRAAVVDSLSRPTIAVVQACLLLAYNESGSDDFSGSSIYSAMSTRMAQGLGLQKLEGMDFEGRIGPTPKTAKKGAAGKGEEREREQQHHRQVAAARRLCGRGTIEERRAREQERIDTFYCVFFLDRVVSFATGNPVSLQDRDIEVSFPYRSDEETVNSWPDPFPWLMRIVHLYGRVTDVLHHASESTSDPQDMQECLVRLEEDLKDIHRAFSPKLHFSAPSFQHYVRADQGTTYMLLHLWLHGLVVLLNQPALFHSVERRMQPLSSDGEESFLSSAKTIADVVAFTRLVDFKSYTGSPFTAQPVFIAACAFLDEVASHTSLQRWRASSPESASPVDRQDQPGLESGGEQSPLQSNLPSGYGSRAMIAGENYLRCYKALQSLETYWAAAKYFVERLDGKADGIRDILLVISTSSLDSTMASAVPHSSPSGPPPFSSQAKAPDAVMDPNIGTEQASSDRAGVNRSSWRHPNQGHLNSSTSTLSFICRGNSGPVDARRLSSGVPPTRYIPAAAALSGLLPEPGRGSEVGTAVSPASSRVAIQSHPLPVHPRSGLQQSGRSSMPPPVTSLSTVRRVRDSSSAAEADLLLSLHSPSESRNRGNRSGPGTAGGAAEIWPGFPDDLVIESQEIDIAAGQIDFPTVNSSMAPWLE